VRSPRPFYPEEESIPIKEVVAPKWREFVVEKEADGTERVNRLNYEMCVLQALREKVRTKEVWVVGANRFRNPDDDLPTDFEQNRATYYDALHQPRETDRFIEQVKTAMQAALRSLDAAMPRLGRKVRLLPHRKKAISLSPLEAQPEPRNLISLKREVGERWSNTNLLDILKETALRTDFLDFLTSVASRERLPREVLHRRLLLCLYGLGTNTGFKRLPSADPGTTYADLRYVSSRYIHKEQLRNAIAHVANAIFEIRKAEIWGEGTTACASDSKKFGAWNQNLLTEWHIRYRGAGHHDLLARGTEVGVHLLPAQKLLFLGGGGDDRGNFAPLHQCGDPEKLRGYPRAERGGLRFLPFAGLSLVTETQGYRLAKARPA